jgi:hypothetical protein
MPDFTSTPTLVIGIGGTGLKAATLIKKSILEANRNQIPTNVGILAIDTENDIKWRAGGWGLERTEAHATGPVGINTFGEYIPIVGNVRPLGEEIMHEQRDAETDPSLRRTQPHRHISPWFQAGYYLNKYKVDDAVWNLDVGAGRLRQFGRIGLFSRLQTVTDMLRNALEVIRSQGAANVYVHVVGSLAGGTGSALFADVPHLVKQLASVVGFRQTPIVFGHFVLAEAFSGTPQVQLGQAGVREDFDARSFAALRELTRLQGVTPQAPYPMIYDPRGTGEMSARIEKPLFAAVYLYDGDRANNSLKDKEIHLGVAPTIADAVVAYIDGKSSGTFTSHSVNFKSFYSAYRIPADRVTYGSIGTYTIELPIYHVVEGWAHDLAREALDTLLAPQARDAQTGVPTSLKPDAPGATTGGRRDPKLEAERWLNEDNTGLVAKLADWGKSVDQPSTIRMQRVDEALGLDAHGWQQFMAPGDADWQTWVTEAQGELEGNLRDPKGKYYVSHKQSGGSNEQRALNMQGEVDRMLKVMVGDAQEVWLRSGGEFGKALKRLSSHHYAEFSNALVKWLALTLNGSANLSDPVERRQGKLGYARAFLQRVDSLMKGAYGVLTQAKDQGKTKRRPLWDGLNGERQQAYATLNSRGAGLMDNNAKKYRDASDELAQFHKADVARQVALDLVEALQVRIEEALTEIQLWERILATAKSNEGGAYALVVDGKREVVVDRAQSKSAVRWVIEDNEPEDGAHYIQRKREQYSNGDEALKAIVGAMEWKIGQADGRGALKIEFTLDGKPWDRLAGVTGQQARGVRNTTGLLNRCRRVFENAWTDMSVTDYLHANFATSNDTLNRLAERVYSASGALLSVSGIQDAPMRSTFMRVYKDGLDQPVLRFLQDLRSAVATHFRETTNAQQRMDAARLGAQERGDAAQTQTARDYADDSGENSHDRFKLTFVMFGDLVRPENIRAFKEAEPRYHIVSGMGDNWRTLHVLPAETHAVEIERELARDSERMRQRRRELDEDVVRVLEDIEGFSLAMHALAYGEADYDWKLRDRSGQPMHERGQLLHKYKPPTARNSYWRLRVEPAGRRAADGRVYEDTGNVALPESYQLSAQVGEPDLLQAFVQLLVARRDLRDRREVNIMRIEDTLRRMMREHAEQWRNRPDKDKGWSPLPRTARDAQLLDEAHDLAAQIIRLSAFIAQAEAELNRHPWAWKQAGRPPEAMEESERVGTQRYVDLWTALRAVALREVAALERRFRELADWNGPKPIERIDIDSGVASAPLPPTPKGETEADEAPADADIDIVPVEMTSPTAAKPTTNGKHDPRIDELEAKLRDLENERSEGFINEDEYQEASAALRAEIAQLKQPPQDDSPSVMSSASETSRSAPVSERDSPGSLGPIRASELGSRDSQARNDIQSSAPSVASKDAALFPADIRAQLEKLARREQRLRDELEDGDISQADYERRMADIARERTALQASKQSATLSAEDARAAITKLTRREKRAREAFEDGEIDKAELDKRIAEIANELIRLEAALHSPPRMSAEERQAALDKLIRRERRVKEAFDDAEIDRAEYDQRLAEIAQERQALEDVVVDN